MHIVGEGVVVRRGCIDHLGEWEVSLGSGGPLQEELEA